MKRSVMRGDTPDGYRFLSLCLAAEPGGARMLIRCLMISGYNPA